VISTKNMFLGLQYLSVEILHSFYVNYFLQCVDALKTTGHQTPLRRQKCLKFAATGEQVLEGNKELPF